MLFWRAMSNVLFLTKRCSISSMLWYKASSAWAQEAQQLKDGCRESRDGETFMVWILVQIQRQMLLHELWVHFSLQCHVTLYYVCDWPLTVKHTDSHPLNVSWPRRRTRCASLWSTVPVKRLAWYGPFPVWLQATWTAPRHITTHPSRAWVSFPDPIGRLYLHLSPSCADAHSVTLHFTDPDWAAGPGPGSRPNHGVHSTVRARQRKKG